jgi:diguanylate cyclase (GGDEF)-like protein
MKRFSWTGLALNGIALALVVTQLRRRRKLSRLAKRVRREAALLHTAIRITHEIRGKTDIPLMLTVATEQISSVMSVAHCLVILHEDEQYRRVAICSCGRQDHEETGLLSMFETASHEIKHRHLDYFLSHAKSPEGSEEVAQPVIAVPIRHAGGAQLGCLFVLSTDPRRLWFKSEVEMLLAVGYQLSLSVELARIFSATQQQALTDPLTSCLNRRAFDNTLDNQFRAAQVNNGSLSLMILDIDLFKRINDNYDHDKGDIAIRTVAKTLLDITDSSGVVARFGGDEFAVILPGYSADNAGIIGEEIRERVAMATIGDLPETITVSIGIATFPSHALSQTDLFLMADKALLTAKASGRNSIRIAKK